MGRGLKEDTPLAAALKQMHGSQSAAARHTLTPETVELLKGIEDQLEVLIPDGRTEVRVVDPATGGEKGSKLARYDLIPAGPLKELAEHFGKGCAKYADRNWERGYKWSLSFAAAMRHAWQFWSGEDLDEETRSKHAIAAAWHFLALAEFMDTHRELDDRPNQ